MMLRLRSACAGTAMVAVFVLKTRSW